jgi:hypothetical protein
LFLKLQTSSCSKLYKQTKKNMKEMLWLIRDGAQHL